MNKDVQVKALYLSGLSSLEIAEKESIHPRAVQRIVRRLGITRDAKKRFVNAIKRGRMKYERMPKEQLKQRKGMTIKLRYHILQRDGYRCSQCGNTAKEARIQVDHINNDATDNREENLIALCELCNKGKAYNT